MLKRREALWTFVQGEGVEPTNNTAERSIRPGVQWRKGSFGTQSENGSRFVERMMTVGGHAEATAAQCSGIPHRRS
jgi:transposase